MTKPPDRVWVVMDSDGFPRTVNDAAVDAKSDEDALNQFNRSPRFDGPYTTHEYRLHRPIPWRTGVPDAETIIRCRNQFALLLPDGGVLRGAVSSRFGWRYPVSIRFNKAVLLTVDDFDSWCPEDEMPTEGKTT